MRHRFGARVSTLQSVLVTVIMLRVLFAAQANETKNNSSGPWNEASSDLNLRSRNTMVAHSETPNAAPAAALSLQAEAPGAVAAHPAASSGRAPHNSIANKQNSTAQLSSFRETGTKRARADAPSRGPLPSPGTQPYTYLKPRIPSTFPHKESRAPLSKAPNSAATIRQMPVYTKVQLLPVSGTASVPVTSNSIACQNRGTQNFGDGVGGNTLGSQKCSQAEIERKRQEALKRKRARLSKQKK